MIDKRCRVLVVFGTRPEAIKMAPVIAELASRPADFEVVTCATSQHREMLDQTLRIFGIVPDIDLNLMQPNQTLSGLSSHILENIDPVLVEKEPNWVLVQGDTTTVMMTALAAQHRKIHVGHVEAGLRTYDRSNPFPEEMNRVVTDHVSDLLFAPTPKAKMNLLQEGIDPDKVEVTGNTGIDALLSVASRSWDPPPDSACFGLPRDKKWMVVTAHRRENHGKPLEDICSALRKIAEERCGELEIFYPVHRNPNVLIPVQTMLADIPGITLLPTIDYQKMVYLLRNCTIVLTDSGGLQEECPSLKKPVLVLRETTERPEAVEAGAAKVVGTNPADIIAAVSQLLDNDDYYSSMQIENSPYGDGRAAIRIADMLIAENKRSSGVHLEAPVE